MSNLTDLTAMTRQERLMVILDAFGNNPELYRRAEIGINALERKQMSQRQKVGSVHVVHRTRMSMLSGSPVIVDEYLTDSFVRGSMIRRWGSAYDAKRFSYKDAQRAAQLQGEGQVLPEAHMPISGDKLSELHQTSTSRKGQGFLDGIGL